MGGVFLYLVFSVLSLLSSLSLVSCAGSAATAKSSGTSGLCVRVPKTQSTPQNRAAQYAVSDLEVFTVIVESGRFSKSKSCGQDEILEFTDLPVGHYTVTAFVKKADGTLTGRGDATSVDIEADVIKEVTITIHRLTHYTIQFNNPAAAAPTSVEVTAGEKLSKPANPTNPNLDFEFAGWFTGTVDGSGNITYSSTAYNFDSPVSSEFTLYAKWVYASSTFVGNLTEFTATTFKANTISTPYTVRITGIGGSVGTLGTIANLIGGASNKGIYINLDISSFSGDNMGDDTFNAASNPALATYLTGITLPGATLGHRAFMGCTNLSGTITIPAGCHAMGIRVFMNTGVTGLVDADSSRIWQRVNISGNSYAGWQCYINQDYVLSGMNADGSYYYAVLGTY